MMIDFARKKGTLKRLLTIFLSVVLIVGLTQIPVAAQQEARLRIAPLIPNIALLDVRLQPVGQESPLQLDNLPFKQITDYQSIMPGRYEVEVRSQDTLIMKKTYGIGVRGTYTLALFGIKPLTPVSEKRTLWANLKWIFGGVEATTSDGYLPQMHLLNDDFRGSEKNTKIRVMHAAPGVVALLVDLEDGKKTILAKGLQYPKVSKVKKVDPGEASLAVSMKSSPFKLIQNSTDLEANTMITAFVVGSVTNTNQLEVVIAENTIK